MMFLLFFNTFLLLISSLIMVLASIISKKSFMDREKSSPFECGFDPISSPRLPFSLQFFLIIVIFLIFDVEITLLIPFIMIMKTSQIINYSFIFLMFIIILLLGVYYEWNQGALSWTK